MERDFQDTMSRVAQLGEISDQEAQRIFAHVYQDGIVSVEEAESLFRINDKLAAADANWNDRFAGAIKDFLLTRQAPEGWITEEEGAWLISQIEHDDRKTSLVEIDLLLTLLRYADGAPHAVSMFALNALAELIKQHGTIDSDMVERVRRVLFAPAGDSGLWVSRNEANILFEINDAIGFAKNDAAWNDLFARAVGNHLMASAHPNPMSEEQALSREAWLSDTSTSATGFLGKMVGSFANGSWFDAITYDANKAQKARDAAQEAARKSAEEITSDESAWFMKRLGWGQKISPAERALIDFLKAEAPGFADGLTIAA